MSILHGVFMRKLKVLILSLSFFAGCAISNENQNSQEIDYSEADLDLIAALVERGSDANKEHLVSYTVDCSTEAQVKGILAGAIKQGFEDDYVSYSEKNKVWSTSLTRYLKLNLSEISSNRAKIIPLMPAQGCKSLGWGASVVM